MFSSKLNNDNLEQVLLRYAHFNKVEFIKDIKKLRLGKVEQVNYDDDFNKMLKDKNIGCIIRMAIDELSLEVRGFPTFNNSDIQEIEDKYLEYKAIFKDKKKDFNKIVKMFHILKEAKIEKAKALIEAIELYNQEVRPHLLKARIAAAIGWSNSDVLRKVKQIKLKQLEQLEGQTLTNKDIKERLKQILGKPIKRPLTFLKQFFDVKSYKTKVLRKIEIKDKISLNDLYNLDFSQLKEDITTKDNNNRIEITVAANDYIQDKLTG